MSEIPPEDRVEPPVGPPHETPLEADAADAAEQASEVELDEDERR